ncbi:hypothetical protein Bhyg_16267, partial [Pseudolycoriella hygida]
SKMTDNSTGASEKTTVTKKQTELKSGDSVTLAGDATDEPEDVEINVEFDDDDEPSNINFLPEERRNGCDNTNMKIPTSDQGPKKYVCVYCMKRVSKLVRHLSTVHKNEDEVRKLLALPVGSLRHPPKGDMSFQVAYSISYSIAGIDKFRLKDSAELT